MDQAPLDPVGGGRRAGRPARPGRDLLLEAARDELVEHGHAAISLRAVARRAGLSHGAPRAHFVDRAGLLTAVATEGFEALALSLETVGAGSEGTALADLGRAYVSFGLANPALFDLMFRPSEVHGDDEAFLTAQSRAISVLAYALDAQRDRATGDAARAQVPDLVVVSWAFVHGLVTLTREGALAASTGVSPDVVEDYVLGLVDVFAQAVAAPAL